MRGLIVFQKLSYREISPMRDRPMRGPPVLACNLFLSSSAYNFAHYEFFAHSFFL